MPHTCQDGVLKPQIAISLSPEPAGSQAEHPNWKCWDYLSHLMISKLHQSPPSPSRKLWVMSCLQHSPARGKEKALSLFPSPLCLIPASQTSFLTPLPKSQQLALLQGAVQSTTRWYREESTIPKKPQKNQPTKFPMWDCRSRGTTGSRGQAVHVGSLRRWEIEVSSTQLKVCASHKNILQKSWVFFS